MISGMKPAGCPGDISLESCDEYCGRDYSIKRASSDVLSQLSTRELKSDFPLCELSHLDAERLFCLAFCKFHKEKGEEGERALALLEALRREHSGSEQQTREFCEAVGLLLFFFDRESVARLTRNNTAITAVALMEKEFCSIVRREVKELEAANTPFILWERQRELSTKRAHYLAKLFLTREGFINSALLCRIRAIFCEAKRIDPELDTLLKAFEYGCSSASLFELAKEIALIKTPCKESYLLREGIKASLSMNSEWELTSLHCKRAAVASLFIAQEKRLPASLLPIPLLAERMAKYIRQLNHCMVSGGVEISLEKFKLSSRLLLEGCDIEVNLTREGMVCSEQGVTMSKLLFGSRPNKLSSIPAVEEAYYRMGITFSNLTPEAMDRMVGEKIAASGKKGVHISSVLWEAANILSKGAEEKRYALYLLGVLTILSHFTSPLYVVWQKLMCDIEKNCKAEARTQRIERAVEALLYKKAFCRGDQMRIKELFLLFKRAFREMNPLFEKGPYPTLDQGGAITVISTPELFCDKLLLPIVVKIRQLIASKEQGEEESETDSRLFDQLKNCSGEYLESLNNCGALFTDKEEPPPFYDAFTDSELFCQDTPSSPKGPLNLAKKFSFDGRGIDAPLKGDHLSDQIEKRIVNPGLQAATGPIDRECCLAFIDLVKREFAPLVNGEQLAKAIEERALPPSSLNQFCKGLLNALLASLRRGKRDKKSATLKFYNLVIEEIVLKIYRGEIVDNALKIIPAKKGASGREGSTLLLFFNPIDLALSVGIGDGGELKLLDPSAFDEIGL